MALPPLRPAGPTLHLLLLLLLQLLRPSRSPWLRTRRGGGGGGSPDVAPLPMRYPPIVDMLLRRPLLSSLVALALLVRVAGRATAVALSSSSSRRARNVGRPLSRSARL